MDSEASPPHLPAAETRALLEAQVVSGEELRRVVACASGPEDLSAARSQVSSWSTRNERILTRIFGSADRDAYRATTPMVTSDRSFTSQQTELLSRIDARLAYLSAASARASPTRRWRAFLRRPWTVGVGTGVAASLIVLALLAARSTIESLFTGNGSVTGTVVCESGRPVVGVWIAASTGQRDSGYAHLGGSYPKGSTVTYSYQLASGESYSVHVGCGGRASDWASSNYSPLLHARSENLRCDDPVAQRGQGTSFIGTCIASTRA